MSSGCFAGAPDSHSLRSPQTVRVCLSWPGLEAGATASRSQATFPRSSCTWCLMSIPTLLRRSKLSKNTSTLLKALFKTAKFSISLNKLQISQVPFLPKIWTRILETRLCPRAYSMSITALPPLSHVTCLCYPMKNEIKIMNYCALWYVVFHQNFFTSIEIVTSHEFLAIKIISICPLCAYVAILVFKNVMDYALSNSIWVVESNVLLEIDIPQRMGIW